MVVQFIDGRLINILAIPVKNYTNRPIALGLKLAENGAKKWKLWKYFVNMGAENVKITLKMQFFWLKIS